MVRPVLGPALIFASIVTAAQASRADPGARFVVELVGARPHDYVCIASAFPPSKDDKANEVTLAASAREIAAIKPGSLHDVLAGLNFETGPVDPSFDWVWHTSQGDGPTAGYYLECLKHYGAPAEAWDARLLILELAVSEPVVAPDKKKTTVLLHTTYSLRGTSLDFEILPRRGRYEAEANRNELRVVVTGGSYQPLSTTTQNHRAILALTPNLPTFAYQLPNRAFWGSNAAWGGGSAVVRTSGLKKTMQARVSSLGVLEGSALPGTEFTIETPDFDADAKRGARAIFRTGQNDLALTAFALTWSPPPTLGTRATTEAECPEITFPGNSEASCVVTGDRSSSDPNTCHRAPDPCHYWCTAPSGITPPAPVHFEAGDEVRWEDFLAWGHFGFRSFADPKPVFIHFKSEPGELFARYVVIHEDGQPGIAFHRDCSELSARGSTDDSVFSPAAASGECTIMTSKLRRRSVTADLRFDYHGGARFDGGRLQEEDGVFMLPPPRRKPVWLTLSGGMDMKLRFDDGISPNVNADAGLQLFVPLPRGFALSFGAEARFGTRAFKRADIGSGAVAIVDDSVAAAAFAPGIGVLHCIPCAGHGSLGWIGLVTAVAFTHPISNANVPRAGDWTADTEGGLRYRFQPTDDGIWGFDASAELARDGIWNGANYDTFASLRGALGLWLSLY